VGISKGKVLDISKYKLADVADLDTEIKKIVEKNKGAPMGAIMGKVMAHFKGKVDGKTVSELVRKFM